MIRFETRLGCITITNEYFAKLIGNAVTSCYGVASMVAKGSQWWRDKLTGKAHIDTGIVVRGNIDKIDVAVHIAVLYGTNINAISQSIVNNVKYTVENETGIQVDRVTIHVDGMLSE